ncbi:MAG TPA: hypothetical protein VMS74_04430 [Acidimicrobiia bacterium]|nr:hypothetical protein [Acidimicrobiia bacterium]
MPVDRTDLRNDWARMRVSAVLFIVLTLGACTSTTTDGSAPESPSTTTTTVPLTTTSATAPATTAPTTSTTTIPPGPDEPFPPEDLVANPWRVGLYFMEFGLDGTYEVGERPDVDPFEGGTWELDGAQLTMTTADSDGGCRPGAVGSYWLSWADDRSRINVTLIDDRLCSERALRMVNGGLPPVLP